MSEWWHDHRNLATVARHMLEGEDSDGAGEYDGGDVLYMLEKPWKFADVWLAARRS